MWWQGRMCGFDLETTAPQPELARIVSAALVSADPSKVNPENRVVSRTWLADPGVPIPAGATEVHGITTERVRAEGRLAREVIAEVTDALEAEARAGAPLIIFNARYDLTVLDRECRRHGIVPLDLRTPYFVIDPFGLDKFLDRYRKSYLWGEDDVSSRTLEGMARVYRVTLAGAHDAAFDALAGVRLAWCMGQRGQVIRRVRNWQDREELENLSREWEEVRYDLAQLYDAQRRWALAERARFAEYKRSQGEHDAADRIESEQGWPVLEGIACKSHGWAGGDAGDCPHCASLHEIELQAAA